MERLVTAAHQARKVRYDLKQSTIDAVLVDFINYVGTVRGYETALVAKDLFKTEERTVPATHFCETLKCNVDNVKLSDAEFRERLIESHYFRIYAFTNQFEFLAVILEHYFETPLEFEKCFPDLYKKVGLMLNFK